MKSRHWIQAVGFTLMLIIAFSLGQLTADEPEQVTGKQIAEAVSENCQHENPELKTGLKSIRNRLSILDDKITNRPIRDEISDEEFISEVHERFAEVHNYTDNYQCLNYSGDYETVMENLGFDVDVVIGKPKNKSRNGHAWTCLHVEPQHGSFVRYQRFNETTAYADIQEYVG
jgi:hypothetical protein